MKKTVILALFVTVAFAVGWCADESGGLVAHYFKDPDYWNGNWPDSVSVPRDDPAKWTFTQYQYSRVEPLINHLFVNKGWFSVRWTGYFDPSKSDGQDGGVHTIAGKININPNNSSQNEFVLTLPDGSSITRDDLAGGFSGYSGRASAIHVKPKGNGNQNDLIVDGQPFTLVNADTYDICASAMMVELWNERCDSAGRPMGKWWLSVTAMDATITHTRADGSRVNEPIVSTPGARKDPRAQYDYIFEIWADDGCRLTIDGKRLIDDWCACWELSTNSVRRSAPVRLGGGPHSIVIEYFQGQSLTEGDTDPMKLYWSSTSAGIVRQVVPAVCFSHGSAHLKKP